MGAWGYKPLENDSAADFVSNFSDSKDISILERAFDSVNECAVDYCIEASEAEEAIAAAQILTDFRSHKIKEEDRRRLITKSDNALERILKNSELRDLWFESDEYEHWKMAVRGLINERICTKDS